MKKLISIVVPAYNEEGNVENACKRITQVMSAMPQYDYEIIFADNCSQDKTRDILRVLCSEDEHVKAIFNSQNVGVERSGRNAMFNAASGDAIISIPCDMQEPPEMFPQFLEYWEQGYRVVWGQRIATERGFIDATFRKLYYRIIDFFSEVPQYKDCIGFGVMDRSVIEELKKSNDLQTAIRHQIADLGYRVKLIPYSQSSRTAGKSSYNLYSFIDFGISSLCTTSRKPLFFMTMVGLVAAIVSFLIGVIYLVYKLIFWQSFSLGSAPILLGLFFIGSVQLFCLGIIGEYIGIMSERSRTSNRALAIEDERIGFE